MSKTASSVNQSFEQTVSELFHATDLENAAMIIDADNSDFHTHNSDSINAASLTPLPLDDFYPALKNLRLPGPDMLLMNDPVVPGNITPATYAVSTDGCSISSANENKDINQITNCNKLSFPGTECKAKEGCGNLKIQVLGVPPTGAKSRVETQIKICLRLVPILATDGVQNRVNDWTHIRLDETLLASSKLRKSPQQQQHQQLLSGAFTTTMVTDVTKILQLEAKVVCSNDLDRPIRMCAGCVRREKKRAERTKNCKSKQPRDLSFEEMEAERNRVVIFNCNPLLNFSSGDVVLPTRITCYCRHHNEKAGFRIRFALKNYERKIIATGISPPIMITDDHKNTKHRKRKRSSGNEGNSCSLTDTPDSSRSGSVTGEEVNNGSFPTTPVQTPTSITDGIKDMEAFTPNMEFFQTDLNLFNLMNEFTYTNSLISELDDQNNGISLTHPLSIPILDEVEILEPDTRRRKTDNGHNSFPTSNKVKKDESSFDNVFSSLAGPALSSTRTQAQASIDNNTTTSNFDTSRPLPRIEKIVPSRGPIYGGTEVTLLGSGFHQGLTCLFGEHPATTVYWTESTIVCILPPASHPGPVIVSFKEHPLLIVDGGHDVAIFTYYDTADQALLELALQVVGLKMTGKMQSPKQIAMDIVNGGANTSVGEHANLNRFQQHHYHQPKNNAHYFSSIQRLFEMAMFNMIDLLNPAKRINALLNMLAINAEEGATDAQDLMSIYSRLINVKKNRSNNHYKAYILKLKNESSCKNALAQRLLQPDIKHPFVSIINSISACIRRYTQAL